MLRTRHPTRTLQFGLFHGDPHPGNIFCLRDGRIAYVDFGNVAQLSQRNKVRRARHFIGVLHVPTGQQPACAAWGICRGEGAVCMQPGAGGQLHGPARCSGYGRRKAGILILIVPLPDDVCLSAVCGFIVAAMLRRRC